MNNPFSVHPPEELTPEIIAANFVEMYTDFPKLREPVNLFIHGPRGAGKSIMLRSLEKRVQALLHSTSSGGLPFFAVHVPIKRSFFGNPEFGRLAGWKATTVGEHLLSVHAIQFLFESLFDNDVSFSEDLKNEFSEFWLDCGGEEDHDIIQSWETFKDAAKFCERETSRVRQYFVRLPDQSDPDIYSGALTAFNDFVLPLLNSLFSTTTVQGPICFMIDDADNLPEDIQRVLNSWVSSRATKIACFKVTTQLGYKTYRTVDGRVIESPHDFSEINIGSVYTSNKGNFAKRIEAIVEKRLENAGIKCSPREFFPEDQSQMKRKEEIWNELLSGETEQFINLRGTGSKRRRDLAQRYAIPALMRELFRSKSTHTYSYAGLQSLIDLSSGVVRWFLEPATQMYHEVESSQGGRPERIPVKTQDFQIREWSKEFRERLNADPGCAEVGGKSSLQSMGHSKESYEKLGNLLDGIGWLCRKRLLDETASEQRLFSFALAGQPESVLDDILHLGVRLGYLQKADLASKNHLGGRRPRYILSRRLGPYYQLDVSGYAAHLSVKPSDLNIAMNDPKAFVATRLDENEDDQNQKTLDFGDV